MQGLRHGLRDPKIEILELKEDFIKFVLSDTDVSIANALRRVMIGEVPTMAIDLVEIKENSSVLHDEFIAHRLGMLPLRVTTAKGVDQFVYRRDCTCTDHCPNCSVEFELDITNENPDETLIVYSSDLTTRNEHVVEPVHYSSPEEAQIENDEAGKGIAIAKLATMQKLNISAVAFKGTNKIHAKWCPVSVATFAYDPVIELNEARFDELDEQQKLDFIDCCPTKVFSYDNPRNKKVVVANRSACMFCDECTKLADTWTSSADEDKAVVISTIQDRFIFAVETNGALRPEEVVLSALQVIQKKLRELQLKCHEIQSGGGDEDMTSAYPGYVDTGGFL